MKVTAQAACRVDMAGGTVDIWPLYLYHPGAVTVNFAVTRFTSCTITTRDDSRIVIRSKDLGKKDEFASLEALRTARGYRLPLVAWVVRFFAPPMGLEIETDSESPAGAGISGSSALIITLASALNKLLGRRYGIEKIREIAQNVESQIIRVPTGCQDYYPAMYGGVGVIELREDGVHRRPIDVDLEDFNQRIVLAYTGEPRNSGINNWEVFKSYIDGDRKVPRNFDGIVGIAVAMRGAVEKGDWTEAGRLLREEWAHRKRNAPGITTPLIDRLVTSTRRAGALGAKVCGAGGGGCVFLLVDRGAKERVSSIIERGGATVLPVQVAREGVRVRAS
ncbi:MAG TPA: GHMP kinase [Solibacterales bacterium]|nr:GHMP kinase [Bryobacterales bacterium]